MNQLRSAMPLAFIVATFVTLCSQPALAQQAPANTPVRTVLALTRLPNVVDAPLFFKLSKVELAPSQSAEYLGSLGFLYVLNGSLSVQMDTSRHSLQRGDGLLVTAGQAHILSAVGSEAAILLHFALARASELDRTAVQPPAMTTELYRTPGAVSQLKPGPYEFTLTRVSFPPRMPLNAPHYRSGAALYYVLSGSGIFAADGRTERKESGTPHFEPHGWVHQWGNTDDVPLVLLQANISEEGVPAVITVQPPSGPSR